MFKDDGLQVIVKLTNIELTPEKPDYEGEVGYRRTTSKYSRRSHFRVIILIVVSLKRANLRNSRLRQ